MTFAERYSGDEARRRALGEHLVQLYVNASPKDHDATYAPCVAPSPLRFRDVTAATPISSVDGEYERWWRVVLFNRRRNPNPFPRFRLIGRRG